MEARHKNWASTVVKNTMAFVYIEKEPHLVNLNLPSTVKYLLMSISTASQEVSFALI